MPKRIDITGHRFGRLTAIRPIDKDNRGNMRWLCQCDCGKERIVLSNNLRRGLSASCGDCGRIIHGHAKRGEEHSLYTTWESMRARCNNPNDPNFKNYGARGITVCERWNDFANFLADVGSRPIGLVLDRIDNDGNYSPENIRWTDWSTSNKNKRVLKRRRR